MSYTTLYDFRENETVIHVVAARGTFSDAYHPTRWCQWLVSLVGRQQNLNKGSQAL